MMDQPNWVAQLKSAATEQACADADAELARSLVKSRAAMSTDPNVQMSALLVEELTGCRTFLHQLRDANMLGQAAELLQTELCCTDTEATEILERFMKGELK